MTVKELIRRLECFPEDAVVLIPSMEKLQYRLLDRADWYYATEAQDVLRVSDIHTEATQVIILWP